MRPLRNSTPDQERCERVCELWRIACGAQNDPPTAWGAWGGFIDRVSLDGELPRNRWAECVEIFTNLGWQSPEKLAHSPYLALAESLSDGPLKGSSLKLWAAPALFYDLSSGSYVIPQGASGDAEKLIRRLKHPNISQTTAKAFTVDVETALRKTRNMPIFINLAQMRISERSGMLMFRSL